MAELAAAYRGLIDDVFHRRRVDRLERYVTEDYQVTDAFQPGRAGGIDGLRAYGVRMLTDLEHVRYDLVDQVERGDRLQVRYVASGRGAGGRPIVSHGLSMHHGRDGRLCASWNVADLRDLGVRADDEPAPALVERWRAAGGDGGGPLAQRYRQVIDRLYGAPGSLDDLVDPEYVTWDPFLARAPGAGPVVALHQRLRRVADDVRYEVIETFEDGDRLAARFLVRGLVAGSPVHALGLSINHVRERRLRCGAVLGRYGRLGTLLQTAEAA